MPQDVNNETMFAELEKLFGETEVVTPTPAEPKTEPIVNNPVVENDVTKTQAFATRLKESTAKAVNEERESIAKSLGFNSYEELMKSKETKIIEEKGLDPEQVNPVIDEIVKKRIESDPRIAELEEFRKQKIEEFGRKELAEITKLTGGEITSLAQLSPEVLNLWKTKGSLKSAYMELEGEKLITKMRSEQSKGTTAHLNTPNGSNAGDGNKRFLTDDEKRAWLIFNPGTSQDELNKITVDK